MLLGAGHAAGDFRPRRDLVAHAAARVLAQCDATSVTALSVVADQHRASACASRQFVEVALELRGHAASSAPTSPAASSPRPPARTRRRAPPDGRALAALREPLEPELAQGLEHPVAAAPPGRTSCTIDLSTRFGEQVGHVLGVDPVTTADRSARSRSKPPTNVATATRTVAARIGPSSSYDHSTGRAGSGARPSVARAATPASRSRGAGSRSASSRWAQRAHARGRQLERERQAVEAAADLHHRGGVVVGRGRTRTTPPTARSRRAAPLRGLDRLGRSGVGLGQPERGRAARCARRRDRAARGSWPAP